MEFPEPVSDLMYESLPVVFARHILLQESAPTLGGCTRACRGRKISHYDLRTFRRKSHGNGSSQTARGPGD
jgi:hypothetical protein